MSGKTIAPQTVEDAILRLVAERGEGKTICPSEAARALGGPHPDGWGPLMQPVRKAAIRLKQQGRLSILRKGKVVEDDDFKGVYRLSLPRADEA
jgi:hypothetical protein